MKNNLKKEIKLVLKANGYEAKETYVDAVAEYIMMTKNMTGEEYDVKTWLKDTEINYPEELVEA